MAPMASRMGFVNIAKWRPGLHLRTARILAWLNSLNNSKVKWGKKKMDQYQHMGQGMLGYRGYV